MKIKLYNTISFNYIILKLTHYLGFHGSDYIRNPTCNTGHTGNVGFHMCFNL